MILAGISIDRVSRDISGPISDRDW